MADPNRNDLVRVAQRLGDLNDDLVYIGGVVAGLLITDPAAPEIRATNDVDCIVEVATRADYDTRIRELLLSKGFAEMQGEDIPICAWTIDGLRVDVMPTNDALGFHNPWYEGAMRTADLIDLGPITVWVISPPYFLATKLVAFEARGNDDFLGSHDLEDIVALVDGRQELIEDIKDADDEVTSYLKTKISDLLANPLFTASVPGHVVDSLRTPVVLDRLRQIAGS